MTLKDISEIYFLQKELKSIKREIEDIKINGFPYTEVSISSPRIDGMPRGSTKNKAPFEYAAIKRVDAQASYLNSLKRKSNALAQKISEASEIIDSALDASENPKERAVIRCRCKLGFSWSRIGEEIDMDRRSASKMFSRIFSKYTEDK